MEFTKREGKIIMQWKQKASNKYPDIILSDCIAEEIQLIGQDLFIGFAKSGIVIREKSDNQYYRTMAAQVELQNSDIDNISIKFIRKKKSILSGETAFVENIELFTFMKNISSSKWKFEIVEEFYSNSGGIFIGKVRMQKESVWCHIKIYFKNINYYWDEVDYRYRFN